MTAPARRRSAPRTPDELAAIAAAREAIPTLTLHELRALVDCPQTGKRVGNAYLGAARERLLRLGLIQRIEDPSWRFGRTVAGEAVVGAAEARLATMREATS